VEAVEQRFGFAEAAILLPVGEDELELVAVAGTEDLGVAVGFRQPVGRGVVGHAAETRAPYVTNDIGSDPYYFNSPGRQSGSALALPMLREGQLLGVLYAESSAAGAFGPDDVQTLETLANQVATALENARLFEAERAQRELAEALREVGIALGASLDFETVLDRLLDQIARVVAYDTANIMLVDPASGRTRMARLRGYERFGAEVVRDTAALSFDLAATENLRRMDESGQPLIIPDTAAFPGWVRVKASAFIRSWAGAPIRARGQTIAFFSLGKCEPNFYRLEMSKHRIQNYNSVLKAPLDIRGGYLYLPKKPGLGVELDLDFIEGHPDPDWERMHGR